MECLLGKNPVKEFAKSQGLKIGKLEMQENFTKPFNSFTISERHMLHNILTCYFSQLFKTCHRMVCTDPLTINTFFEVPLRLNTSIRFAGKKY